ncbi:ATP-binding protein [Pseudonocardia humida]|uniref:ATP-binding protein n=1 Tax=Pseudonocardia humida TaxID=2800819 RepID=A0ABT0ZWV5_9PSEU|nr:ATP-binding protein [Pseudonocardia humida]MCO1655230.1 ATP-binding protein [Pseudonocardia humida]
MVAPPARPAGGWHEAVAFDGPVDLATRIAPRITAATVLGDPVLAVLAHEERGALRAVLGDTADHVRFLDPADVHTVPPFTVAVGWARTNRWITEPGGRALVVGQHLEELPGCGPEYWARLDIALDVATADLPVTVLCPFPTAAPQTLVHATHPHVGTDEGVTGGLGYRPPHEAVIDFPPPPPPDLGRPVAHRPFDLDTLAEVRGTVTTVACASGLAPEDVADLVLAVNELASNSIEHGPGAGVLRMWDLDGDVVAEVFDGGHVHMPFPGLTLPPPEGERGRGLWLASELCDVLQVWSEPGDGTTMRLTMNRERVSRPAP